MYVRISTENKVVELIPDLVPELQEFPIEQRYTEAFLNLCIHVADDTNVHVGMLYDHETSAFSEPVVGEPDLEEET